MWDCSCGLCSINCLKGQRYKAAEPLLSPWKKGFWYHRNNPSHVCKVKEHTLKYRHLVAYDYPDLYSTDSKDVPIQFGSFGKVGLKEIVELTGKTHFNFKIGKSNDHKFVMNDEGTKAYFEESDEVTREKRMDILEWISDEEFQKILEEREDIDYPSCPYDEEQPKKKPGMIFWLTGVPGSGKSTTCQLMARNHGFVYLEVDGYMFMINPFPDLNKGNPSVSARVNKALKGVPKEDVKALIDSHKMVGNIFRKDYTKEQFSNDLKPQMEYYLRNIKKQHERLGGDFALAWSSITRAQREFCKKILGPNLVFICLEMDTKCQEERLKKRHPDEKETVKWLKQVAKFSEPAGDSEENVHAVWINNKMSEDEVVEKVLTITRKYKSKED